MKSTNTGNLQVVTFFLAECGKKGLDPSAVLGQLGDLKSYDFRATPDLLRFGLELGMQIASACHVSRPGGLTKR